MISALKRKVSVNANLVGGKRPLGKKELEELIRRVSQNDPEIVSLQLANHHISNTHLNSLLDAIQTNKSITEIDLSGNGLLDVGVIELLTRLHVSGSTTIKKINVRWVSGLGQTHYNP
jgi:hypothetical protein